MMFDGVTGGNASVAYPRRRNMNHYLSLEVLATWVSELGSRGLASLLSLLGRCKEVEGKACLSFTEVGGGPLA